MLRRALVLAVVVVAIAIVLWLRNAPDVAPALEPVNEVAEEPRAALAPELDDGDARNPAVVAADVAVAEVVEVATDAAPLPRAKFDRGCEVTVVLRSESGLAIEKGTSLSCTDERGNSHGEYRVDPSTYVIQGVPLGPHRLAAFAPGHAHGFATFEVRAEELEKRVEVSLRALEGAAVPRTVLVRWQTEDGRPFVPAIAAAWKGPERAWLRVRNPAGGEQRSPIPHASGSAGTAENVARKRPGAPADSFAILAVGGAAATIDALVDSRLVASAELPAGAGEVVLRASVESCLSALGGVRGCVVSAAGEVPVKGLRVSVERADGLARSSPTVTEPPCFLHENLPPGPALLRVADADRELVREISIESGRVLDLGELTLTSGCALRLKFVGTVGEPIAGVRFECFSRDDAAKHEVLIHKLRTARLPTFAVTRPPNPAFVLVQAYGFTVAMHPIRPCGERGDEVEIRLERGVEVVLDLGLGDMAPALRLETAEGLGLGTHPTLPTGFVRVDLAPGEYRARRSAADEGTEFRVGSEPIVVRLR